MKEIEFISRIGSPVCIALGFFDSVHLGHRSILEKVKSFSASTGFKSAVFTFSNNAYKQFNAEDKEIYTFEERKEIFAKLEIDYVVHAKFDKEFKAVGKDAFIEKLLSTGDVKKIYCGYDYLFGKNGEGSALYLKTYCAPYGVEVEIVPQINYDNERVSSSNIKNYLLSGEIQRANMFLTEPFFLRSSVVHGRGVGRQFGFPTANQSVPKDKLLPKCGVYGTYAFVAGQKYKAVTNVGAKPTFGDPSGCVETFIQGLSEDIYGKELKLEFITFIRDIKKFDDPESLSAEIHKNLNWRENA